MTLLQQDNVRPHTSNIPLVKKIGELEGIELLPFSACSPDLAPSDFHMFRSMTSFLRGMRFFSLTLISLFASKSKEWYRKSIVELANKIKSSNMMVYI